MQIRLLIRFPILAGVEPHLISKYEKQDTLDYLGDVLNRSLNRFSVSIRSLYYAMVVILWFVNAYIFIAATILLTVVLLFYADFRHI